MFDQITEELTNRQQELDVKLNSLTHANFSFLTTISHLLDLAQRANQLFQDADITTKNKLLKFLPANCVLYDKKLSCMFFYPYKAFQELNKKPQDGADSSNWCQLTNVVITSATQMADDFALQELVNVFQLSGELL